MDKQRTAYEIGWDAGYSRESCRVHKHITHPSTRDHEEFWRGYQEGKDAHYDDLAWDQYSHINR